MRVIILNGSPKAHGNTAMALHEVERTLQQQGIETEASTIRKGYDMAIQVTYRRTRRLSMRIVKNGDVHVSAPIGMPKKEVERFIEEHRDWITEARKKTLESQKRRADFYSKLPLKTREQADDALRRLKALIEPMVERHSKEMGVKPSAVSYKAMISRWGVCNVKDKSICFSIYLLLLPEWCIEHVVVHELCHLLEPTHNARFHALMDKFFPRWKEARKETRRNCKIISKP